MPEIVLTGRYISELHALLTEEEGRIFIEGSNSTFGTFVNGIRITKRTELNAKDRVKLGTKLFHWQDHIGGGKTKKSASHTPIFSQRPVRSYRYFGLGRIQDHIVIVPGRSHYCSLRYTYGDYHV